MYSALNVYSVHYIKSLPISILFFFERAYGPTLLEKKRGLVHSFYLIFYAGLLPLE
jgi:hypothetical protein